MVAEKVTQELERITAMEKNGKVAGDSTKPRPEESNSKSDKEEKELLTDKGFRSLVNRKLNGILEVLQGVLGVMQDVEEREPIEIVYPLMDRSRPCPLARQAWISRKAGSACRRQYGFS